MAKTYYETLGVNEDASSDVILDAYRNAIQASSDEQGQSETEAAELARQIALAFHTLSDPSSRKEYDALLSQERLADSVMPPSLGNSALGNPALGDPAIATPNASPFEIDTQAEAHSEFRVETSQAEPASNQEGWNWDHYKKKKQAGASKSKSIRSVVSIILGGVMGVAVAFGILWGVWGLDPLGLFGSDKQAAQEDSADDRQSSDSSKSKTNRQSGNSNDRRIIRPQNNPPSRSLFDGTQNTLDPWGDDADEDRNENSESDTTPPNDDSPLDTGSDTDATSDQQSNDDPNLTETLDDTTDTGDGMPEVGTESEVAEPSRGVSPFSESEAKAFQAAWAEYLGVDVEVTNAVGIQFVLIPPGQFLMGNPRARSSLERQHQVTISEPFYLSKHEITQAQFRQVMFGNPSQFKPNSTYGMLLSEVNADRLPVDSVSWLEADVFCRALSRLDPESSRRYRLPFEAEWEFACRAGSDSDLPLGMTPRTLPEYAWIGSNSGPKPMETGSSSRRSDFNPHLLFGCRPHEVGTRLPNHFGVHDMFGNVREWCQDYYGHYPDDSVVDPTGPDEGTERILRGAASDGQAGNIKCAQRDQAAEDSRSPLTGFRIVMSVAATGAPSDETLAGNDEATPLKFVEPPFAVESAREIQQHWADRLGIEVEKTNEVGMKFVLIPPSSYLMGQSLYETSSPQHRVEISRPFYLSVTEVTQAQYAQATGDNPSHFREGGDRNDAPVEMVTWQDADQFCEELSKGPTGQYRLPTEAEWEFVRRAGSYARFWFADDTNLLDEYAWNANNSGNNHTDWDVFLASTPLEPAALRARMEGNANRPRQVGKKPPNPFGVYDLEGNVSEWCLDYYDASFFQGSETEDPVNTESSNAHVVRGGNFLDRHSLFDPARRLGQLSDARVDQVGFRVVLEIPDEVLERAAIFSSDDDTN